MNNKHVQKNRFMFLTMGTLLVVILCFSIYTLLNGFLTLSNVNVKKWDGVSISSSFSIGNGSKDNPFVINNGEDLALFKKLIETDSSYSSLYYVLGNDIDLGNNNFNTIGSFNDNKFYTFSGHFDGRGYSIVNAIINDKVINGIRYLSLFSEINNASICNLNLESFTFNGVSSNEPLYIGGLAGNSIGSSINNISINNFNFILNDVSINNGNNIGGLFGKIYEGSSINNIYLGINISTKNENVGLISNYNDGYINNVIINSFEFDKYKYVNNIGKHSKITNIYNSDIKNNEINLFKDGKNVDSNIVIRKYNNNVIENYHWIIENEIFKFRKNVVTRSVRKPKAFAFNTGTIQLQPSGVNGDTLNVNDLDNDYRNYIGLNYTYPIASSLPNGNSQKLYDDSNLVKVYVQYNGMDLANNSLVGNISLNEQISKINYFKYYKVVNGFIEIELIDNPFADRPDNKVFNGWVTNYKNVSIRYDKDIHTYFAKIPVSDVKKTISVVFNASWVNGNINIFNNGNNAWGNAFKNFQPFGISMVGVILQYDPVDDLFTREALPAYQNFPKNSFDRNGKNISGKMCNTWWFDTCEYYIKSTSSIYDPDKIYYRKDGKKFIQVEINSQYVPDPNADPIPIGAPMGGYYKQINIARGQSLSGYYAEDASIYGNVNCSKNGGCNVYELISYLDENGNINGYDENAVYGRLVSRDTNIAVLNGRIDSEFSTNYPFTLTSVNNGRFYNGEYNVSNVSISLNSDFRLEEIGISSGMRSDAYDEPSSSRTSNAHIYGHFHNLKIGRGIRTNNNVTSFNNIIGGNNYSVGASDNVVRYKYIIESGRYNNLSVVNGTSRSGDCYIYGSAIFGSDIDRINKNNNNLDVYNTAAGSWGGNIYSSNDSNFAIYTTVKSGKFGSSKNDYTSGIYVGGLNGGRHHAMRGITVEGGYIYNLLGGPLSGENRSNKNDIFINVKGGSIDYIIGGAGRSETYGNRIINVTDGIINYAIFGGSNGYQGSDQSNNSRGTLTGSTLIYVGGNGIVGNDNFVSNQNNNNYGEEIGSVFGIGNGKSSSVKIGTASNSMVIIDGNANIKTNVYGGGNYGAVGINNNSTGVTNSTIKILGGTINGSVYGGGNNNGSGSANVNANINIYMINGIINGSVYGGSNTKGTVFGNSNVSVLGGTIKNGVYGGGEGGPGQDHNGTFITKNVYVNIGENNRNLNIEGNVYGGSAYGTVNGDVNDINRLSNYSTNVVVNNGVIKGAVFGGGRGSSTKVPYVLGNVNVTINGGNIGEVYGGNDASGSPKGTDIVLLNGGIIGNCFGGGNNTGQNTTDIRLQGANVNNLFGGSNKTGTVNKTSVLMSSGTANNIFGGNNLGGMVTDSVVNISGGKVTGDIYGGGSMAPTNSSNVTVGNATVNNIYGGGQKADCSTTTITINGATGNNLFGGSNVLGNVKNSNISFNSGKFNIVYGGNNIGGTTADTAITTNNGNISDIYGGGEKAISGTSKIIVNNAVINNIFGGGNNAGINTSNINVIGGTVKNIYGGSNNSGDVSTSNVLIGDVNNKSLPLNITNVYGGNNAGGTTSRTNVNINYGTISTVYGGGNLAPVDSTNLKIKNATITNIYGGGNEAYVSTNTFLDIDDSILNNSVYGGGNKGEVKGNSNVYLTNSTVNGSLYAGGNGAAALVSGNTSVTIDGNSVIGYPNSKPPYVGCVFGGGNAATTGIVDTTTSRAIVNIVGGHIYGNVYGGANTSVVNGGTIVNIGSAVVTNKNLIESDLIIDGTVFGGGEANAAGNEEYDFTFLSVIGPINIYIDGTNYINNNHKFNLKGSIFGSGNASSSSGSSSISVKKLGTKSNPSKNISFQRTNLLTIDNSFMELEGIKDRTNEYSDIPYTFNQIDKLIIKNNTTLMLQRNANLLKEFYSGVDVNGELVPAKVTIDDKKKTVTKNVDNRIYALPNRNLNITTNQSATAYGKVTGMTFFGMYNSNVGGYKFGIYDSNVTYGSKVSGGDAIFGGSYVLGLHDYTHNIKVDGFYTNKFTEDFTNAITEYINPIPDNTNYYRWIVGMNAINYNVTLTASKYSSLGTYNLSLLDFAEGDTIFNVIGFDSKAIAPGISFIEPALVPRISEVPEEANKVFGLAMKSETREWTSYGTTKFLSKNGGEYFGDTVYKTDSQKVAPSFMLYLYHAKNISINSNIATVVILVQALTPINEIEYKTELITITVDITARNYSDGNSYDASITYDKKYDMPSVTPVNITNQSQFTTYYSLYATAKNFNELYGNNNTNYRTLVSNYALPVGTQITMIDYGFDHSNPQYYYYDITENVYNNSVQELQNNSEIAYRLSDFIKMGSTTPNNHYSDKDANLKYYDTRYNRGLEEFIFIVDMKETNTSGTHLNNSLLLELRNKDDRAIIGVLGIRQPLIKYNLYDASNAVLQQNLNVNNYLYYNVSTLIPYETDIMYDQTGNREVIIDTNYESSSMGLNISFYNSNNLLVSSGPLMGTVFKIDNKPCFADSDGIYRVKLSGKVSNLKKNIYLETDKKLPEGVYTIRFVLFASDDGKHNSSPENSITKDFKVTVVGDDNALRVDTDDKNKVVSGITGLNQLGLDYNTYRVSVNSVLSSTNVRVSIYKRKTDNASDIAFDEVNFNSLFSDNVPMTLSNKSKSFERTLDNKRNSTKDYVFHLNKKISSGTYKIVFKLYDGDHLVDQDSSWLIVTKNIDIK